MSKSAPVLPKMELTQLPSVAWRWVISICIVFHLGLLALTYATNWRRSPAQDQAITLLQPYLIGANWYHEMLPVELYSEESKSRHTWLESSSYDSDEWTNLLDNSSGTIDKHSRSRLLRLVLDLVELENNDGLGRIMVSLVDHYESNNKGASNATGQVDRIRLMQSPRKLDESREDQIVFEGDIVRFENGERAFVSKTENRRTVRALPQERGGK